MNCLFKCAFSDLYFLSEGRFSHVGVSACFLLRSNIYILIKKFLLDQNSMIYRQHVRHFFGLPYSQSILKQRGACKHENSKNTHAQCPTTFFRRINMLRRSKKKTTSEIKV